MMESWKTAQAQNEKSRCGCSGFFGLDHPWKDGAQEKSAGDFLNLFNGLK
jgi:hypothetical protein|tara:strand:- start:316 stop:465 length:150 start_codon:yes stop_codon:yes gene_type:complete